MDKRYETHFIKNNEKIKELRIQIYELSQVRMITKGKLAFENYDKILSEIQEKIYFLEEDNRFYFEKLLLG